MKLIYITNKDFSFVSDRMGGDMKIIGGKDLMKKRPRVFVRLDEPWIYLVANGHPGHYEVNF